MNLTGNSEKSTETSVNVSVHHQFSHGLPIVQGEMAVDSWPEKKTKQKKKRKYKKNY